MVWTQPMASVEIFWKTHVLFITQLFPTPCSRTHFKGQKPGSKACNLTSGGILNLSTPPLEIGHAWNSVSGAEVHVKREVGCSTLFASPRSERRGPIPGCLRSRAKHPLITAARAGTCDDAGHRRENFGSSSERLWPHAAFLCLPSACSGNSANQNSLLTVWVGFKHLSLI